MISAFFLALGATILVAFLNLATALFGVVLPDMPDAPTGFAYVFSNIYLLNSFLPVTDFFIMASFALVFKGILFAWRIIIFFSILIGTVVKSVVRLFI